MKRKQKHRGWSEKRSSADPGSPAPACLQQLIADIEERVYFTTLATPCSGAQKRPGPYGGRKKEQKKSIDSRSHNTRLRNAVAYHDQEYKLMLLE
jgi:hypothetical protein